MVFTWAWKRLRRFVAGGRRGVLQLPALAVRRHHHVPRDLRGVGSAVATETGARMLGISIIAR